MLEVKIDPEIPPLPPHITVEQAKKMATAMVKGDPERVGVMQKSLLGKLAGVQGVAPGAPVVMAPPSPLPVERLDVAAYTIPTDEPESDGTLEWDSTTIVVVEAHSDGHDGLGYTYTRRRPPPRSSSASSPAAVEGATRLRRRAPGTRRWAGAPQRRPARDRRVRDSPRSTARSGT